ncbi:MAG TPA: response regulator [Thiobacillus sp.]|jgi:DNA-binding NarL/FixJ family response regulator|nr:response regulator [Thiobacillus sp.]
MKLLLVEPSILLRERLAAMLSSLHGVEIVEIAVLENASRAMQGVQPEVVVMGVQKPDEGGLEDLARARSACPAACMIVVSSYSPEVYRKRWLQAGADHFYDLSAQIDLLLNTVTRYS